MTAKKFCGAKKRQGAGTCRRPAGWGTDHPGHGNCKLHGGSTSNGRKSAQKEIAKEAVTRYGLPREVDPDEALLEEVHRTAGHVAWLGQVVAALEKKQITHGVTKTVQLANGDKVIEAKATVNVWLRLYQDERDRLVRVCRAAIEAGIAERRVRIAEQQAVMLAAVVKGILADLGHSLDDPHVQETVRMRLIEGGSIDPEGT